MHLYLSSADSITTGCSKKYPGAGSRSRKLSMWVTVSIGGEGEIRTHEPREGLPVFKSGIPHSCAICARTETNQLGHSNDLFFVVSPSIGQSATFSATRLVRTAVAGCYPNTANRPAYGFQGSTARPHKPLPTGLPGSPLRVLVARCRGYASLIPVVPRGGIKPPTRGFSVVTEGNLSRPEKSLTGCPTVCVVCRLSCVGGD